MEELETDGTFRQVRSWQWHIDLSAVQLRALFASYSDWDDDGELDAVRAAGRSAEGG